jgi:dTDP-glucose 4,6-dehydratase
MANRKRVLITGAAGFLGSHLCDRFIKEDYHVIAMDNLITGDLRNIEGLFKLENFEFYHHDVSKFVYIPGELHYILHFASPASPIDYLRIPIQTLKVGSLGTHNLLGLARSKKARMLIAFKKSPDADRVYIRSLRRSECKPATRRILGQCKPYRAKGCL